MAGTAHKTTAGSKKTGGSKHTKKKTKAKSPSNLPKEHYDAEMQREVWLLLILAVAAILALSNFGVCGAFGKAVSDIMFGFFGWMAYLFPFCLFFGAAFLVSNGFCGKAVIKFVSAAVLYLLVCMLLEMIFETYGAEHTLADYYKAGSTLHRGGGLSGGALELLLRPFLGTVGSYVTAAAGMAVAVVLITERSLIGGVKKGGAHLYETAKEDALKARRESRVRQEDKRRRRDQRMDKKVKGVVITDLDQAAALEEEPPPAGEPAKEEPAFMPEINIDMPEEILDYTVNLQDLEIEEAEGRTENGKKYRFPSLDLLRKGRETDRSGQPAELRRTAAKLQETLHSFGVEVTITNVSCGPSVTRYELQPQQGVKVSRIVSLADDIKLNLAAADIRIEAPIPGKAAVGIEVPNRENAMVMLRDLLESEEFRKHPSKLAFAVGRDIGGQIIVADIAKMPHLLIAGATGSGKSVCMNTLIMSILYKAKPDEVKLIMIDPKVVELSVYNKIPHLLIPVVTDLKEAAGALNWAVAEMTDRYNKFAKYNVRDLEGYNEKTSSVWVIGEGEKPQFLPRIVILVDELADLMMVAPKDVEEAICRLAQLARAAGIHLVIATQRPSVNVITGVIKANIPSRIAFSVSSGVDSRTIIDMNGAEKLLGKGDMLFYPAGYQKPVRVQGAFVSDKEVGNVVDFLGKETRKAQYNKEVSSKINNAIPSESAPQGGVLGKDDYFAEAGRAVIEKEKASIGVLQRMFKIGFNRAARIMDQLTEAGAVGPEEGTKPRKILMTMEEFEAYCKKEAGREKNETYQ